MLVAGVCLAAGAARGEPARPVRVLGVDFEGARAFPPRRLERFLETRRTRPWYRHGFDPETFARDLRNLQLFYRNQGYLRACVLAGEPSWSADGRSMRPRVRIAEGPRWNVQNIAMHGVLPVPESELLAPTVLREGSPYRRAALAIDFAAILGVLARYAYLDARLVQDVQAEGESVRVDYALEPGVPACFGRIEIQGTRRTRPHVVVRELRFDSGDPLTSLRVAESEAGLIATGLFESVHVGPLPGQEGRPVKDVQVVVSEKPAGEASLGAGWASTDGARLRMQLRRLNLLGTGRRLGLDLRLAERRRVAEASGTQPWLLGTRTALDLVSEYAWALEPGFTVEALRGGLGVRRGWGRSWSVDTGYEARRTHLLEVRAAAAALRTNRVGRLSVGAARDTRDDLFDTRHGSLARVQLAVAHARLGGGQPYLSAGLSTRGVLPLGGRLHVAGAVQHTGVWLQRAGDELPLEDRLYAGGAGSVRGFPRHAVGPRDAAGRALGGNHRSELSLELRLALGRRFEAAAFADAGQLVRRGQALRLDGYAVGCGAGARLHTALGLLRADLAFPVAGIGGEGAQLEAGVGQAF